ncbi:MAG: dihydroneopterin aldolase [Sulfuricurvum sp.]|nr:dihydroneopterin aldolase [Sulfuricurvum sp.]
MKILIEDLEFEAILGILESERLTPQKVSIRCTIEYAYSEKEFINYAEVANLIEKSMTTEKFFLIEEALDFVTKALKKSFPLIRELTLTIRKPNILSNCTVGVEHHTLF